MQNIVQQVHLGYTAGSHDKVYIVTCHQDGPTGYSVMGANARRGNVLVPRPQTKSPVSRGEAQAIFDKLVAKKLSEGYKIEGGTDTPQAIATADEDVGMEAPPMQLLTPVTDDAELEALLNNDRFLCQPKYDSKRLTLVKRGTRVLGFNRRRKSAPVPTAVSTALAQLRGDVVCDAEVYAAHCVVYDVQESDGVDLRANTCEARLAFIASLVAAVGSPAVRATVTAIGCSAKRALYERLLADRQEGIVFKDRLAPYTDDRPATGGPQRKRKFWKSCTVKVISSHPSKRSIGIGVFDERGVLVPVGNVTVKANQVEPPIGAIVECKYLYAFEGGSLFQPELLLDRSDEMTDADCSIAQLVYKVADAA